MQILYKPKVYCIGRPAASLIGLQQFLGDNDLEWPTPTDGVEDAAIITEAMGRNCYMSYGAKAGSKTNQAYINNLLGRLDDGKFMPGPAHGSVLEHVYWNFIVVGAGRGYSHEQVRHRVGTGYSQLSTRYCDYERSDQAGTWAPRFCVPPLGQLSKRTKSLFSEKYHSDQEWYKRILAAVMEDLKNEEGFMAKLADKSPRESKRALRKAARGAARDVLPIGAEAIMGFTANARAIWNMAYLRASEYAEGVIRAVFVQVLTIMEKEFPTLFHGLKFEEVWDGSVAVILPRPKL